MGFKLHGYQEKAVDFILKNPVSAIFLEMGLGKTLITLTAIYDLMFNSCEVEKVLVIAPLRVANSTWSAEIQKWTHLKGLTYSICTGTEKKRVQALTEKADIYIINRENVAWLVRDSGLPFDFDMVVIDELSSFKSSKSTRFKNLLSVRPKIKRIVGLTGTPSSNGLMDLWSQFRILDQGERLFRYITHFRTTFFDPDKRNGAIIYSYKIKKGAEELIYSKISDITMSMTARDHLEMPEYIPNYVLTELSPTDRDAYAHMKKEMVVELEGAEIDAKNAAVLSGKLIQFANGCMYDENKTPHEVHTKKLEVLEDLVEGANGKPVLVAYWYQHDLSRIKEIYPEAVNIKTDADILRWNKGEIPVALIHPAGAGHGLNLQTGGSTLIWFSLVWSLELYQQTNARLWRQGQENTVVIHHIVAKGTLDEDVIKALANKNRTQTKLIDAVKLHLRG